MKDLFGGRYTTTAVLGQGGMGRVYLAKSNTLGTKWAIKEVHKSVDIKWDLLAEPNILKRLNHPLLPRIVDIAEDNENIYIVMDYIEGTPLNKMLDGGRSVSEADAAAWSKNLCDVLMYLHSQQPNPIIYRDMKPSNVIITPEGLAKVIDFGISREYKAEKNSDTQYMGTHGYAPPEQWGIGQTDQRSDIYSLGVTMYQMVTGKSPNEPPYEFKPVRQLNPNLSEGIEYIINKCVQPDPQNRYQSVEELLWDLDNIHLFNSSYQKRKAMRKVKIAVEVLLLLGGVGTAVYGASRIPGEQAKLYNDCVDEGYAALADRDFDTADEIFGNAIDFNAKKTDAYLGRAQIYYRRGDLDACADYLSQLEDRSGFASDGEFNYLYGTVFFDQGNYEDAAKYLEKAVNVDADNVTYIRDLAVSYARCGDLPKAQEYVDKLKNYDVSEDINAYVGGELEEVKGNTDLAIEQYEHALELTEDEDIKYKCYKALSDVYLDLRHEAPDNWDYIKAQIDVLERSQKDLKNKHILVLNEALAEVYFVAQRHRDAINEFSELLNQGYERDYIYRNIAIIYQDMGDYDNARDWLDKMQQKFPDSYLCYVQLCYLTIEEENAKPESQRDYAKALEYYEKAADLAPQKENDSAVLQLRALINELKSKGWL